MRIFLRFAFALAFLAPSWAMGQAALLAPNWDRRLAAQVADLPDNHKRVEELFALARGGDTAQLNSSLDEIVSGAAVSEPARDFILYRFAVGLADMRDVDPKVIDRLRNVKARVMVSHPDRATVGVPLFNIAAAAEGVRQLGLRRDARRQAELALEGSSEDWIDAYLRATRTQRMGFADALESASNNALREILESSLVPLPSTPELTPVAGKAALLLGDSIALASVAGFGSGGDLARILEAAAATLPGHDALAVLEYAIAEAPASNAALAIAQIYPRVSTLSQANDLLLGLLEDTDLGGAAALALAASTSPKARASLQQVALEQSGLASVRARSALDAQGGSRGLNR